MPATGHPHGEPRRMPLLPPVGTFLDHGIRDRQGYWPGPYGDLSPAACSCLEPLPAAEADAGALDLPVDTPVRLPSGDDGRGRARSGENLVTDKSHCRAAGLWNHGTFVGKVLVQRHVRVLGPGPGSPGTRACWSDQRLVWQRRKRSFGWCVWRRARTANFPRCRRQLVTPRCAVRRIWRWRIDRCRRRVSASTRSTRRVRVRDIGDQQRP